MEVECTVQVDVVKVVFKGLNALITEARFRFREDGLKIRAVDPANVAMVLVDIPDDSFEAYSIDEDEVVVGVDVNRVYDFVKGIKNGEMIDIAVDDERLVLTNRSVSYELSLIAPDAIRKEPRVPQIDLPARIVMDAEELKKFVNLADKFADHVVFRADEDGFYIEAEGDVDGLKLEMGDADLVEFNQQKAKSMFSLEYLKEFVKIASKGDLLTIRLGTDYPVWLAFELCEGKCKVEYILAPRIEAE
ncbi:monomeric archaeal DNA polymerase sliding clamp [Archaeoglobus sulfaticallidus PM70-1]|uniref:DNA polymerase sliding clamp n=1 Tax=Archaeoglobus sulfaticallidus PM70-1 TaxID=387631 RepID=N0BGT8_9EURY|nr:DNA polymerase sliding clamp [Archaeoglobus sulfaticallidus]AGK61482.1 monomeric archaeal DNA polymerase sliding clamp [Archaeoglobus sulfaticallidus PM70-1]